MRLIIEARVETKDVVGQREPIRFGVIERDDDDLEYLGFSLEEGRTLMAAAQSAVVGACSAVDEHAGLLPPLYHSVTTQG
jgi:hypothetical protein